MKTFLSLALCAAATALVRDGYNLDSEAVVNDLELNGLSMRQGDVVTFRARSNPTTGRRWLHDSIDCEGIVEIDDYYIQDANPGDMDGVGGY